jgi:hypothetical protein
MANRRGRPRIEGPIESEIEMVLAIYPAWSPTQVHRYVNRMHGVEVGVPEQKPEVVGLRTVQRRHEAFAQADESGDWSLADDDFSPEDAALVLQLVGYLIWHWGPSDASADPWQSRLPSATSVGFKVFGEYVRGYSRPWPTRSLARSFVRIRRAYPELGDLRLVYLLATLASRGGDSLRRVETFMALTPWQDEGAELARAVRRGTVGLEVGQLGTEWVAVGDAMSQVDSRRQP